MFSPSLQQIILCSVISLNPVLAFALDDTTNTQAQAKVSKNISYQKSSAFSEQEKLNMLKQAPQNLAHKNLAHGALQNGALQNTLANQAITAARHVASDYSLFDATTYLISDIDSDGFYHRFSVTIDVDTLLLSAIVYANFYLSYEGGPWVYYAHSDSYAIHSDSVEDAFSIETELADGYPTGYYDMRIQVYDANTDEYLLTYDASDDASLVAIPLEDRSRDTVIVAGSMNGLSLLLFCVLLLIRQVKNIL